MNKLIGLLVLSCAVICGCGKDEPKDCTIDNFSEINFVSMDIGQRYKSALETDNEFIILSNFPEVKLSSFDKSSLFPIWANDYGLNLIVGANNFIQNNESNLVITGIKRQTNTGTLNTWILESNQNDININEVEDETEFTNIPNDIYEITNGDYVVTGRQQESDLEFEGDVFVKRINNEGNTIWTQVFNEGISDGGKKIINLDNGNLLICYTWSGNLILDKGIGIIEIDLDGNILRNKKFETHKASLNEEVIFKSTTTGGIIVTSSKKPDISKSNYDPLLFYINNELEIEWSLQNKTNDSSQLIHEVKELGNGDFLILGSSGGACFDGFNMYVSRITNSGTLLWQHTYGNDLTNNSAKYIIERGDGELFIIGDQYEKGEQLISKIVIALFDKDGNPI